MSHSHSSSPLMYTQVDVTAGAAPASLRRPRRRWSTPSCCGKCWPPRIARTRFWKSCSASWRPSHKQRLQELHQWKNANPRLAESCREAAEALSRVQVEYLERMTEEINDTAEDMAGGEFMLNEFVDRFGPRLAHLNGVIQVLAQLGSPRTAAQQRLH